ncbi:MAG TPA: acyl-CoA reductase [Chryseosolibacter sp.]|nr:acyl-CoA reductase [Chryseosolibacter sp.]
MLFLLLVFNAQKYVQNITLQTIIVVQKFMTIEERLAAFEKLGEYLYAIDGDDYDSLIDNVKNENPWFTPGSVNLALEGVRRYLDPSRMRKWVSRYQVSPATAKQIAVIMAGNIPLAGFHDFLCVLISGHSIMMKLSSKDSVLPTFVAEKLVEIEPRFQPKISMPARLKNFDAVIATGSDNSSRYFNYYFGKYPNIIRKNRTSCAVLTGFETEEDLRLLGRDVFTYFGLGCRNVSKIFIPGEFDPVKLVRAWDIYIDIIHHNKYHNNYEYQKSILLVNKIPFYDSGFVILHENTKLVSPISVVYLERYKDRDDLTAKLGMVSDKIQCVVGNTEPQHIPFGQAQAPELWDYADRIDTLGFLQALT